MAELTKQSVVTEANYSELKAMLTSNDEASVNMGLIVLEQSNFEESQVYIVCLLKETFELVFKNNPSKFEKECPTLHEQVTKVLSDHATNISSLSFRKVYEMAIARKKGEELSFMLTIFKEELMKLLGDFGFSFLEYLDIELKPKKNI